ncbi:hypothetical protein GRZ55_05470 [Chelativorans sp. ZYF759]|uniref:hypothetical protein n=1 Tax=Chelativorans sp. ZYF759 TaxID=2692213 RepID=UPI00145CB6C5|nr:hypothetical protein [Chelativorans sp. ZYF759]NMG38690.1 hypothetical protein [Chelativorans sp. ZYF759]
MRFHPTPAKNARQLRHLATLLCALADLAERAAGRAPIVCWLVIGLIRPAEAVARHYVDGIAPGAAQMPAPLRPFGGAEEARRLAGCLRFLAATLAALAKQSLDLFPAAPANRRPADRAAPSPAGVMAWPARQPCPP